MKNYRGLLHFNIRCTQADLPRIEKFYGEVMGLKKGYRPNFRNEGLWLYADDEPILHVGARAPEGFLSDTHNASFDHMAFRMTGAIEFRVAETPVFADKNFKQKLIDACESIVDVITDQQFKELTSKAIPANEKVPNENAHPHMIAFDFGICMGEDGQPEPQLITRTG